jgi:Tetratricopeptide repeat
LVTDPLIDSLRKAVDVSPDDTRLRLHLAEMLLGAGEVDDAIAHCATVLAQDPTSAHARQLMARAMSPDESRGESRPCEFDWSAAEHQVGGIAEPMFVTGDDEPGPATSAWEVEDAGVTLAGSAPARGLGPPIVLRPAARRAPRTPHCGVGTRPGQHRLQQLLAARSLIAGRERLRQRCTSFDLRAAAGVREVVDLRGRVVHLRVAGRLALALGAAQGHA